jgi:hypothetical protein
MYESSENIMRGKCKEWKSKKAGNDDFDEDILLYVSLSLSTDDELTVGELIIVVVEEFIGGPSW